MSRTASRTLIAALAAVFVLAAAEPAVAQKAKARSGGKSGASSSQVKRVAPPQARPSAPSRTVKAAPSSSARSAPSTARSTVRVNRAPAPQSRPSTSVKVNRAPAPQERTTTKLRVNRAPAPQERATTRPQINRAPAPDSRSKTTLKSLYTRKTPPADPNGKNRDVVREIQKKKISEQFTQPRDNSGNRGNGNVDNRGNDGRRQPYAPRNRGVNTGYRRGYDRGYYDGWHNRYVRRYHYRHYHYYGPRRVWGFHYGGFGFYHGYWHFAIVIGGPVIVYRNYCGYYNYCWWDGRGASLVTWDAAVQTYPASYTFAEGACVELWIRTTTGEDYAIKVDPRYWNARDPGDLYAALWAQLDQEGQLQLEDINGVLHVFSAGQILQIEARACR
jgi:hypothetical protein